MSTKYYADLTEEQRAQIANKTPEELLVLAKEQGYDLTDEQLECIAGGEAERQWVNKCPKCDEDFIVDADAPEFTCPKCGYVWKNKQYGKW